MEKNKNAVYCRFCRAEEEPLREPIPKKRLEALFCARCGNQVSVRYVAKKRKKVQE